MLQLTDFKVLDVVGSKLILAPRLYCGVALSKSFKICITVDISRFGRPYRSCNAGFSVPENVPE